MKKIDYERILQGEARLRIVGDLGVLVPVPVMQFHENKDRLWYCHCIAHMAINMKNNPNPQILTVGGQVAVTMMLMGCASIDIYDYAPTSMQGILRNMIADMTGETELVSKNLYYNQIRYNMWSAKDGCDVEIGNQLNALRESETGHILIDGRERSWWEDIFPDWQAMSESFDNALQSYLPRNEQKVQ